jgi:putative ABC transport system permease protein
MRQSLSAFVPGLTMTPSVVVTGLGLMIALGLATGVVPALNAFRLKIVEAMGRG